jgi:Zn-finger nucleic acid-binding protein
MTVETRAPVPVDVCAEHGVWLDRGELERITARARARVRRSSSRRSGAARHTGRLEGAVFGWWSLLFP